MKTPFGLFLCVMTAGVCFGATPDIPPAANRTGSVAFAKAMEKPLGPVDPVDAAALKNPFNPFVPPPPPVAGAEVVAPELSERAQLDAIAPKITPSGAIELGGEALLLFGQKRFKVGDRLPIIFEGKQYALEITDIQSTSFTLRLNGVEITRPIKSVIKP